MPSTQTRFHNQLRTFDVRPDRFDVKDRKYQPKLANLPAVHPDPEHSEALFSSYKNLVLDQGEEGACTGFGLAAMINYLRFSLAYSAVSEREDETAKPKLPARVSPRMLYEHARLYDEWPGEDYEGSSCRGAMKGWNRHGVCLEKTWPYLDATKKKPGKPKPHWPTEASRIPLGAYYRVETDDITAVQSAIHEVGAIFASADVHGGWEITAKSRKAGSLPVIGWNAGVASEGGHAFALVGFNHLGFIVQNSWGPTWGYCGFAILTYEDWLSNATDAWVATMGVPRTQAPAPLNFSSMSYNLVAGTAQASIAAATNQADIWPEDEARNHALVLGNDGMFLRSSGAFDVQTFVSEHLLGRIREWMAATPSNRKIAIYAHGGLNDEAAGIKRIQVMAPCFKANGIFPIFIVWKTGWKESLLNMGEDILGKLVPGNLPADRSGGLLGWLGDKVGDGWDYTVETSLGFLGKSLWQQMKQNAEASGLKSRGGDILAKALLDLRKEYKNTEIHLIGHSAGSIWHGHFLSTLGKISPKGMAVSSCHLFAAACTVGFGNRHYGEAVKAGRLPSSQFRFHNLSESAEKGDTVGGLYRKSLLYFVSRACEEAHKTPILGMEAAWDQSLDKDDIFNTTYAKDLVAWRKLATAIPRPRYINPTDVVDDGKQKQPPSHGGFDNDIPTISRTLALILGLTEDTDLPVKIRSLAGF